MSLPFLSVREDADVPHRLLPVLSDDPSPFAALPESRRADAEATATLRGFVPEAGKTLLLPFGAEQWLLLGLGAKADLTRTGFCEAMAKGYRELKGAGAKEMALLLPWEALPWSPKEAARHAGEALLMVGYVFDAYRTGGRSSSNGDAKEGGGSEDGDSENQGESVILAVAGPEQREAVEAGLAEAGHVGAGVALARDLINHPAAVAHPTWMTEQAREVADALGGRCRVLAGDALLEAGYEAIYTVGRAAENPPALVVLEHGVPGRGDGDDDGGTHRPTLTLVGKGVTFDTGGLDLKPSSAMALMKKDMGGAAVVLGAFRAIAGLGLPLHLVCVLALAENAVDARSYRPGDILRTKQGLTVEITNTDAEGRVVLADALALAREYEPDMMVDFATLTGACRTALGKEVMGLFCDDAPLRDLLVDAARETGDHLWPLPLWRPYRKQLDSPVADMVNAASGGFGGAITAALFLQEFAGEVAWAHIDCYAWSDGDAPLFPKGGSGVGVRLCIELATRLMSA